jgi:diguanylate cyclase (GGDEF)-like protein/PAS domain S-box-containing protein
LLLSLNLIQASTSIQLTENEKQFLQEHPTITLGTNDSWPPFSMRNKDGSISGFDIDVLNLINQATGANFILQLGEWSKVQRMAKSKEIDGMSNIAIVEEKKKWFNFSDVYISVKKRVMVKRGNPLNIQSIDDIDGKTIAVHQGNIPDTKIAKQFKNSKIIYTPTVKDMIEEVIFGKADVLFGNGATEYMLGQLGMPYLDSIFPLDGNLDLYFAIRNDWPEAISILNKGLASIPIVERNKLMQKWFTSIQEDKKIEFTIDEFAYLKNKKEITMCFDPNWMPYEKYENNKYTGMNSEYIKIFEESIGIPIRPIKTTSWKESIEFAKDRKCDILSLLKESPSRKKYLNFTTPYLNPSVVLVTKPNVYFIDDVQVLKTEKIGVVKGYASKDVLLQQYPHMKIIEVENIENGLKKVIQGELFGVIDALPTIAYRIQGEFIGQLKISAKVIDKWEMGIGVRNDDLILLNILNKAIEKLPKNIESTILNKYIGIKYEKGFDYTLFWQIFAVITAFAAFFYVKYYIINNYNKKMKEYLHLIDNNFLSSSTDKDGNITEVSEALCRTTGYTKEELIGKQHNIFRHKDMLNSTFKDMWETILSGKEWRGNIKSLNKDGSYYWADSKITPIFNKNGSIKGFNALRFDITDRIKLKELSITDKLTQVSNRLHLDTNYTNEMKRAKRYGTIFSTIIIDIDFFKKVNDTFGHQIGDDVLVKIARILQKNIREMDILGRWGGEEFLIICPETTISHGKILAEKIRVKIEEYDFSIDSPITCSFGVSQYNQNDEKEDTFKRADKALYRAKESGRNKVCTEEFTSAETAIIQ